MFGIIQLIIILLFVALVAILMIGATILKTVLSAICKFLGIETKQPQRPQQTTRMHSSNETTGNVNRPQRPKDEGEYVDYEEI